MTRPSPPLRCRTDGSTSAGATRCTALARNDRLTPGLLPAPGPAQFLHGTLPDPDPVRKALSHATGTEPTSRILLTPADVAVPRAPQLPALLRGSGRLPDRHL